MAAKVVSIKAHDAQSDIAAAETIQPYGSDEELQRAHEYIDSIDFSMITNKLVTRHKWLRIEVEEACQQYRNYLFLLKKYGTDKPLPPSEDIDEFWHQHILDTDKYVNDCDLIFGKYLHHYPYYGNDGSTSKKDLLFAFSETKRLYQREFYEPLGSTKYKFRFLLRFLLNKKKKNIIQNDQALYRNVDVFSLQNHCMLCGLEEANDLDQIYDKYICDSESLVEVGAGYGRILDNLISKGYKGKIITLERNIEYYDFLSKKYKAQADIYNVDLFDFNPPSKSKVVLLMWSTFCEYNIRDQIKLLTKIRSWVEKDGLIIVDIPDTKLAGKQQHRLNITINNNSATLFIPSEDDITNYCKATNLYLKNQINYKTKNNINRKVLIFTH